jgi:prepilin-type N-terminal cleavage/methylation domain-containing protein
MKGRQGFTIVEVLVAIIVLGVGVVALVGSSALVTRMIGRGKHATRAVQMAEQRLEFMRQRAQSTSPQCTAPVANGTINHAGGVVEQWTTTTPVGSPDERNLTARVTYRTARGTDTITLFTIIRCS